MPMSRTVLDENIFSDLVKNIVSEVRQIIPNNLLIYENPNLQGCEGRHTEEDGDSIVEILPRSINNDFVLTHELFHVMTKHMSNFQKPIINFVGGGLDFQRIVGELNGYIDHRWIAEQQSILGINVNECIISQFPTILSFQYIERTDDVDVMLTCAIAHVMRSYPDFMMLHGQEFRRAYPNSYRLAERLISFFPGNRDFDNFIDSRNATINAISEWNSVRPDLNLKLNLAVMPAFSRNQMSQSPYDLFELTDRIANNGTLQVEEVYGIRTRTDNQCIWHLYIPTDHAQDTLNKLRSDMQNLTLGQFLGEYNLPSKNV
jgi:hypothetical protein